MSVIKYKLKKVIKSANMHESISNGIILLITFTIVAVFTFMATMAMGVVIFGSFNPDADMGDLLPIAGIVSAIVGAYVVIQVYNDTDEEATIKKTIEEEKKQDETEFSVQRTIQMSVVSKMTTQNKEGNVKRELLLKDPYGRVISYGDAYHHRNFKTVFFAVAQDLCYDIEWEFERFDPTGKHNTYYKILKIDGTDVNLSES